MLRKLSWQKLDTDGKIEAIRAVHQDGMSAADIANRIGGITRNAIIGMYDRHADRLVDTPLKWGGPRPPRRERTNLEAPPRPRKRVIRGGKVSQTRLKPDAIFEAPSGGAHTVGLPLSHLRAGQCRFPVNDAERGQEHLFCGAPSDGPWCEHHRRLVYQPSKRANTTDPAMAA